MPYVYTDMLAFKDDSINPNINPEIMIALFIAAHQYNEVGVEMVWTSGRDGKHSNKSKHYRGDAVDLRIWNLPDDVSPKEMAQRIRSKLNHHYDVVLEKTHIHIEYDPRYSN